MFQKFWRIIWFGDSQLVLNIKIIDFFVKIPPAISMCSPNKQNNEHDRTSVSLVFYKVKLILPISLEN